MDLNQLERRVKTLETFLESSMATERIHEEIKAEWRILTTLCSREGITPRQMHEHTRLPHLVAAKRRIIMSLVGLEWNDSRIARITLMTPEGVKKVREAAKKPKTVKGSGEEEFGV